jgi:cytidylate kinase
MPGAPSTVTIDGPVGSGKGTIAGQLAARLGWHLLDSGALYRLVAIKALELGLDEQQPAALAALAEGLDFQFLNRDGETQAWLEGREVSAPLRSEEVSSMASRVAALPAVRAALMARQQAFRKPPGLVADGRDMGTVVFPDAGLKIFLTASVEARAARRYKQLKEKGESVNLSRLLQDLKARDQRDSSREVAPLMPAEAAVIIDSTDLSIEEVVERIIKLLEESKIIN